MKIIYEEQFKLSLQEISKYIARDKVDASMNFKKELKKKIELIVENPEMYRASIYHDNENYRDLIHQGYTTIYKIDYESRSIKILDIFKWVNR